MLRPFVPPPRSCPSDDGNTHDNDGCSASCELEVGYVCASSVVSVEDVCTAKCGDG